MMHPTRIRYAPIAVVFLLAAPAAGEDLDAFLAKIRSPDGQARRAAWEDAAGQGAAAVSPLVKIAGGDDLDAALAARRAIDAIAHAAAAPGGASREAVATALAVAAKASDTKVALRHHLIDLLGSIGGDEVVPACRDLLLETAVREQTRCALERIPGDAAALALLEAAKAAEGEWRDALILTVGKKRAAKCLPELTRFAERGGPGSVAAAMALARIADPASIPVILRVIKLAEPPARSELTDDFVHMGDLLAKRGSEEIARRIYQSVLAHAEDEGPRFAALNALVAEDAARNLPFLMDAVGDSSALVRDLALRLLETVEGTDVSRVLLERFDRAEGRQRAALLRVLAARKTEGAERRIQESLESGDIDVRVTALDLAGKLGDPANEGALVEAFEKGSPGVRQAAFRAYLGIADALVANDEKRAEGMYLKVFGAATDPGDKSRALLGLAKVGNPERLPLIEAAREDADLSVSANQAYVSLAKALGRAGDKEKALGMLQGVITSGASRETIQEALAGIRDLGGDPTVFQKKQGFLCSWRVVGPFPNEGGKGFDAEYSPEKAIDLEAQPDQRGRNRKWAAFDSTNMDGKVDLRQVFQRSNDVCAYAYAELEVPEAMDVKLKMGSDDGIVLWLNGKKLHANNTVRPATVDSDVVDARLEAGVNKVLLKITQGGGEWEFLFRVTDRKDAPIDLTRFKTGPAGGK